MNLPAAKSAAAPAAVALCIEVWNIRTGAPEVGSAGEYHDKLVKVQGKWYFAQREIRGSMSSAPRAPAAAPRQ